MSEQEFESYLRLLARFLKLSGNQREAVARELRAHMEDRLDDLLERGYTREEAIQAALDEFGDAAALAGEFGRIGRRRRWIMRTTTTMFAAAAAVLLVSFLLPTHTAWVPAPALSQAGQKPAEAQAPAALTSSPQAAADQESDADRATRQKLSTVLPVVDLAEGTTIADAVEYLRVQGKLVMSVNWAALALLNIERTTDIGALNLRDVKVETVLNMLLDNASQQGSDAGRAGYEIIDGVVRVSSENDLKSRTIVRVYDCSDLMGQSLTAAQKAALELFAAKARAVRPAGPATQPESGLRRGAERSATERRPMAASEVRHEELSVAETLSAIRQQDAKDFIELITSTIEPESWAPEGKLGVAGAYDGLLVIRHAPVVQRQVAELLDNLRQAKAARQSRGQTTASTR